MFRFALTSTLILTLLSQNRETDDIREFRKCLLVPLHCFRSLNCFFKFSEILGLLHYMLFTTGIRCTCRHTYNQQQFTWKSGESRELIRNNGCITGSYRMSWSSLFGNTISISGWPLGALMRKLFSKACPWNCEETSNAISALIWFGE
jgi:hypothetical protein